MADLRRLVLDFHAKRFRDRPALDEHLRDSPHPLILDREHVRAEVAKHFGSAVELTEDVVAYGSNLIVRLLSFGVQEEELVPLIVVGALGRQVVALLDSIAILAAEGAGGTARIQLRSLIEASLYGEWILASDSLQRARTYYVWNLRHQRRWVRRIIPGTEEYLKFCAAYGPIPPVTYSAEDVAAASAEVAKIDDMLSRAVYAEIDAAFHARRGTGVDYDVAWHRLCGAKTLDAMAESLGRQMDFEFFSLHSTAAHSQAYRDHFLVLNGVASVQPIRSVADIGPTLTYALTTVFRTYRYLLRAYRPDELPAFDRKHREQWRSRHVGIKELEIQTVPVITAPR